MSEFNWIPSRNYTVTTAPTARLLKFGDGYEQRIPETLNTIRKIWDLRFTNREMSQANAIIQFFEDRQAVQHFTWTPPDEEKEYKVIARNWKETIVSPNVKSITVKFERVFE